MKGDVIDMYYEINVSKLNPDTGRYEHYFATSERSITNILKLQKIVDDFKIKFTKSEGFEITLYMFGEKGEEFGIYEDWVWNN